MLKFIIEKRESGVGYTQLALDFYTEFGIKKHADVFRKVYKRYEGANLDEAIVATAQKAQYKAAVTTSTLRKVNKAIIKDTVFKEDFLSELKQIIDANPVKLHKQLKTKKSKTKTKRTILAHVSDTHIGVNINSKEMDNINIFNPTVASRRFAFAARPGRVGMRLRGACRAPLTSSASLASASLRFFSCVRWF